jgi:hypothetical protein
MKKDNNKLFYTVIFIILSLPIIGYYLSSKDEQELDNNSLYTTGIIIKKYSISKRGSYVRYKYIVNGKVHKNDESVPVTIIKPSLIKLGDMFEVKYSSKDASNSRLNFKIKKE